MTEPEDAEPASELDEEDEDSYFDGPYLVFTEAYHRKRGYCCQSGCRHCPFGFNKESATESTPPNQN